MLQNIRKNFQGTIAKVIVGIIVVPFALFGIESLLGGGGIQYVAEVNGEGISVSELQQQVNQQKRRLLMSMGENADPSMLDDQMLAGPTLEYMIQQKLLMQAAADYGLTVSDQRLGVSIAEMPAFQVGGVFDQQLYRRIVSDQGYSPAGFQTALKDDLLMTQLRAGLASSEFATPAEVNQMASITEEQRDIRYLLLPLERFRGEVDLDEARVQQWYESHTDQYLTQESVDLEYIELQLADFYQPIEEERLRELYEQERDSFQQQEERRVSHILFEQAADESDEQLQQRIAAAALRLTNSDNTFAELATELSTDVGSASYGGDLGFTSGDTFPAEIEEAIASLPTDQVSAPVESDAGWHLLKVTELRPGEIREFDSVRGALETRLQEEQAALELLKKVEALRDLVFNADDLAGPATQLELTVSRTAAIKRNQAEGLFANPRLIAAAFSKEVLTDSYNSEVLELDAQHFVVLRVAAHAEPVVKALVEVRGDIERSMADEIARTEIREQAAVLLQRLSAGASIEELALENDYQWQVELGAKRDNRVVSTPVLQRAFQLPAPSTADSSFEFVQNDEGDVEVFELVRVNPADSGRLSEQQRSQLQSRLSEEIGRRTDNYFQQELRSQATVVKI
jgi:peptidyl-prolyl cis-trans isomerase D